MEEDEIIKKDCYYKQEPYNKFHNYSILGLNIKGIKQYFLNPTNSKYQHMIRINKDLEKVIENSKITQKERQKSLEIDNIYDENRLVKMYSGKKKRNIINNIKQQHFNTIENTNHIIPKSERLFEIKSNNEKPIKSRMNNTGINGKEERKNILIKKNSLSKRLNNKMGINYNYFGRNNFLRTFNTKNKYYSLKTFNKKLTKEEDQIDYPIIKPRKIVIEYHLINDANIKKENKNIGHNNYMGSSFNPFNYTFTPKNRNARNVYGGLFFH